MNVFGANLAFYFYLDGWQGRALRTSVSIEAKPHLRCNISVKNYGKLYKMVGRSFTLQRLKLNV